jgi:hypothetical protein
MEGELKNDERGIWERRELSGKEGTSARCAGHTSFFVNIRIHKYLPPESAIRYHFKIWLVVVMIT